MKEDYETIQMAVFKKALEKKNIGEMVFVISNEIMNELEEHGLNIDEEINDIVEGIITKYLFVISKECGGIKNE